jgi:hypothetical protein
MRQYDESHNFCDRGFAIDVPRPGRRGFQPIRSLSSTSQYSKIVIATHPAEIGMLRFLIYLQNGVAIYFPPQLFLGWLTIFLNCVLPARLIAKSHDRGFLAGRNFFIFPKRSRDMAHKRSVTTAPRQQPAQPALLDRYQVRLFQWVTSIFLFW